MPFNITATIPIREIFKQFIKVHYNVSTDPFIVSTRNALGDYITLMFSNYDSLRVNAAKSGNKYDGELTVKIPEAILNSGKFIISLKHVTKLDRFLKKQFDDEIRRNLLIAEKFKIDHKIVVEEFIVKYGLTELISSDTILKQFRRKQGTKNSRKTLKKDIEIINTKRNQSKSTDNQ